MIVKFFEVGSYMAPGMKAFLSDASTLEPYNTSVYPAPPFLANVGELLLSGDIAAVDCPNGDLEPGLTVRRATNDELLRRKLRDGKR